MVEFDALYDRPLEYKLGINIRSLDSSTITCTPQSGGSVKIMVNVATGSPNNWAASVYSSVDYGRGCTGSHDPAYPCWVENFSGSGTGTQYRTYEKPGNYVITLAPTTSSGGYDYCRFTISGVGGCPGAMSVKISSCPGVATQGEKFTVGIEITGGDKPYNVDWYLDGNFAKSFVENGPTAILNFASGLPEGTHKINCKIKDSCSSPRTATSNDCNMTISGGGGTLRWFCDQNNKTCSSWYATSGGYSTQAECQSVCSGGGGGCQPDKGQKYCDGNLICTWLGEPTCTYGCNECPSGKTCSNGQCTGGGGGGGMCNIQAGYFTVNGNEAICTAYDNDTINLECLVTFDSSQVRNEFKAEFKFLTQTGETYSIYTPLLVVEQAMKFTSPTFPTPVPVGTYKTIYFTIYDSSGNTICASNGQASGYCNTLTVSKSPCTNPKYKCSGNNCISDRCDGSGNYTSSNCNNACGGGTTQPPTTQPPTTKPPIKCGSDELNIPGFGCQKKNTVYIAAGGFFLLMMLTRKG